MACLAGCGAASRAAVAPSAAPSAAGVAADIAVKTAAAETAAKLAAAVPAANTLVTSYPNWAGYAVGGGPFRSVSARWVVPTGHCGTGESQAAFWIGMDMTTVEQTGVALDCSSNGARSYSGWYQMYPSAPVAFSNPVKAGDHMAGSVSYQGGGWYRLTLTDTTRHWSRSVEAHSYAARRATAEVIAEASYGPLASFGTVHFYSATIDGRPMRYEDPERINMIESGRELAAAGWLRPGSNFDVTWRHR